MRDRVTAFDARAMIEELRDAGYRIPDGTTIDKLATAWAKIFSDLDRSDLRGAVESYYRDGGKFWPQAPELRKRAFDARKTRPGTRPTDLRSRYYAWEQHSGEGACPVCGAGLFDHLVSEISGEPWEGPGEEPRRFAVIHRADRHDQEGVRWVGPPYRKSTEPVGV